ncbi:MAG: hypothetical protein ABGX40_00980 [Methylococcales bacterium]|nr:hypothetical protein [Rhodospirillales bacterium]
MKHLNYCMFPPLLLLLLTACGNANHRPTQVDNNFGKAMKHMLQAQILNPQAAQNPPLAPPKHMDGEAGGATIKAYRQSFSTLTESQAVETSTSLKQ